MGKALSYVHVIRIPWFDKFIKPEAFYVLHLRLPGYTSDRD